MYTLFGSKKKKEEEEGEEPADAGPDDPSQPCFRPAPAPSPSPRPAPPTAATAVSPPPPSMPKSPRVARRKRDVCRSYQALTGDLEALLSELTGGGIPMPRDGDEDTVSVVAKQMVQRVVYKRPDDERKLAELAAGKAGEKVEAVQRLHDAASEKRAAQDALQAELHAIDRDTAASLARLTRERKSAISAARQGRNSKVAAANDKAAEAAADLAASSRSLAAARAVTGLPKPLKSLWYPVVRSMLQEQRQQQSPLKPAPKKTLKKERRKRWNTAVSPPPSLPTAGCTWDRRRCAGAGLGISACGLVVKPLLCSCARRRRVAVALPAVSADGSDTHSQYWEMEVRGGSAAGCTVGPSSGPHFTIPSTASPGDRIGVLIQLYPTARRPPSSSGRITFSFRPSDSVTATSLVSSSSLPPAETFELTVTLATPDLSLALVQDQRPIPL